MATKQSNVVKQSDGPIPFSSRLLTGRALDLDVWSIYNALALPADCINLGQGYMNFPPPQYVKDAADEAIASIPGNHYSHPKGRPRLRKALSDYYSKQFTNLNGRKLDPETEILITSGANMGMYSVWAAFLEFGDEVILFEPYFDQYLASITFNGGKPVYVPLHPPPHFGTGPNAASEWTISIPELRAAITPRTKMIILNTPHNPVGKVFTRQELESIAEIAIEHNLLVMSDEVYDCLTYEGSEHVRIATFPGMWERTVTVGSAGKSFAATGWRIGWLLGPKNLIAPTLAVTTRTVFCSNSPMQEAAAAGFEGADERHFFETQREEYAEAREVLMKAFDKIGLKYIIPQGSYFLLVDISDVEIPEMDEYPYPPTIKGRGKDFRFSWFVAQEIGVSSIPVSEFYCTEHCHIGERYARFAFCKDVPTLERASERLQGLKKYLKPQTNGNGTANGHA